MTRSEFPLPVTSPSRLEGIYTADIIYYNVAYSSVEVACRPATARPGVWMLTATHPMLHGTAAVTGTPDDHMAITRREPVCPECEETYP